jgi:hypothetical protein
MSRSSLDNGPAVSAKQQHTLRQDLDSEREGRLRRALSFNNGRRSREGKSESKSILGSVKNLYATFKKMTHHPDTLGANKSGYEIEEKPVRPPRKHRSSSYLASNGSGSINGRQPAGDNSLYMDNVAGRSWSAYSTEGSNNFPQKTARTHSLKPMTQSGENILGHSWSAYSRTSGQAQEHNEHLRKGRKVERRQTMSSADNRDPPRFEDRRRDRSEGRFFGQDDQVEERERPMPDMRRLLLNNVNMSRRKSGSTKDLEAARPTIRAI